MLEYTPPGTSSEESIDAYWISWPETDSLNESNGPHDRESFSQPELEKAVKDGDTHMVERTLDQSDACLDLEFPGSGRTMLQLAAEAGHDAMVRLLLDRGAARGSEGSMNTPMRLALLGGHIQVVQTLLDRGAPLTVDDLELGKVLDDSNQPFFDDLLSCTPEIGPVATIVSIRTGSIDLLQRLVKAYPRLVNAADKLGKVPLHHAVHMDSINAVNLLLATGADPNIVDIFRLAPIHYSIEARSLSTFERLLEEMHDIEVTDAFVTPLAYALSHPSLDRCFIERLLERGASTRGPSASQIASFFRCKLELSVRLVKLAHGAVYIDTSSSQHLFLSSPTASKAGKNSGGGKKQIRFTPVHEGFGENGLRDVQQFTTWHWRFRYTTTWMYYPGVPTTSQMAVIPGICIRCLLKVPFCREPALSPALDPEVDTFDTREFQHSISWVLERESASGEDIKTGNFQAVAYGSTLNYGWVPEDPGELIGLLLQDLERRWQLLYNEAMAFLTKRRRVVLEKTGRDNRLIGLLIQDNLRWSHFDDVLDAQVRKITGVLETFDSNASLRHSVMGISPTRRKDGFNDSSQEVGSKLDMPKCTTHELQENVTAYTSELKLYTGELISLEFNIVSISEAQRSTAMALSMKRLSWITFIFLPLMFASSIFGANVNLLADNPEWWWMLVVAGVSTFITFTGWLVFRSGKVRVSLGSYSSSASVDRLKKIGTGSIRRYMRKQWRFRAEQGSCYQATIRRLTLLKNREQLQVLTAMWTGFKLNRSTDRSRTGGFLVWFITPKIIKSTMAYGK